MHALGGGSVGSGGEFPHIDPAGCKAQVSAYITSGAYLREVDAAVAAAASQLGLAAAPAAAAAAAAAAPGDAAAPGAPAALAGVAAPGAPAAPAPPRRAPRAGEVFVFDIDETALSNVIHLAGGGGGLRGGAHAEWDAFVAANASPALAPTLRFYKALCAAGYAVGFVTGRGEKVRAATAQNLFEAGYGRQCATPSASAAAAAPRRSLLAPGAAAAPAAAAGEGECCYVDLLLRPPGDTRLASVYKPWARRQLESKGYTLFGSIGDQFSDLSGEASAPFSVKLPNTFYYIL
ncbi:MAG: HAD superfamily, subfamily IIIB-domain-containing protein [Monoraphidium minutum]|nr:MAG: HAD superfamily, subfamily IIIB-domain-containing protein [Monoraphidium minutum]